MRAVGYLRGLPGLTLEAQYRAYLGYCERHGLEAGPAFTEAAREGRHRAGRGHSDAPQLRRLLRQLREQQRAFTVVVAADLRVLGDQVGEQARRYLQLEALGLPLRLADEREAGAALLDAWRDRGSDERRRERVREAMRRRALRGEALGRPPYGYRIEDRRLVPHPDEAPVVREMVRLALVDDFGVRRIARRLNEEGRRTRRSEPWSMVSVRSILRNPVYTGTYRRLDVVVPGAHEPLVPREHFEALQERLAARRTSHGEQRRHRYLLAGLVRCGHCGNRMIGVTRRHDGRERVSYQCESRQNQSRCEYHTRRAEELEAALREQLAAPPPGAPATPEGGRDAEGASSLDAKRRALRRDLERQFERRVSGQWTAEQLRRLSAPVVLADLEAEKRAAGAARHRRDAAGAARRSAGLEEARLRLAHDWEALSYEVRRALLQQVVATAVVSDGELRVELAR